MTAFFGSLAAYFSPFEPLDGHVSNVSPGVLSGWPVDVFLFSPVWRYLVCEKEEGGLNRLLFIVLEGVTGLIGAFSVTISEDTVPIPVDVVLMIVNFVVFFVVFKSDVSLFQRPMKLDGLRVEEIFIFFCHTLPPFCHALSPVFAYEKTRCAFSQWGAHRVVWE